jgi:hypothetical protein
MKLSRGRKEDASPPPQTDGSNAIFDGGLLAAWYVARRLDEELARAHRCDRQLSVLLTSPQLLPGERLPASAREAAAAAALRGTRRYDLVGWLPNGGIVVIMPETGQREAASVADRLRNEMFRCNSAVGGHKWAVRDVIDGRAFNTSIALLADIEEQLAA